MTTLYCDLETYSPVPIKNGTHAYAEQAEILLFPYAIDDEEVKCWDATADKEMPDDLAAALQNQNVLTVWQNGGMFDLTVLNAIGTTPRVPHSRVFDTMACALSHSLPGGLDLLCSVLNVAEDKAKHKTGKKLIQLFCKPRPKTSKIERATRHTHPEEWTQFIEYAKADISAMREVYRKLPKWNYNPLAEKGTAGRREYDLWLLDQKINARGVCVDTVLAQGALRAADKNKDELAQRTVALTEGEVSSTTKRDALLEHILSAYGVSLPDMQASTLERRMADPDLPEALRELFSVRLQATTTSVNKYKTLINATSQDGRLRGLLQFNGASRTGRWSGRTFQPQNLPRPTMKQADIDFAIKVIKANACDIFFDEVMPVLSNCVRGCLVAPDGNKIVVSDLSNIEGRVAAWLAGEVWKVKYFYDYDEGLIKYDNYMVAYAKSFNIPVEEVAYNKDHGDGTMRQVGKVQELMLQYEGGVGAFVTGAATYRVDLTDLAERARKAIPVDTWTAAADFLKWTKEEGRSTQGLADEVFIACDSLKRLWRDAHPAISSYWKELSNAFKECVNTPGRTLTVRRLKFRRDGAWLRVGLPSGRALCYPSPEVDEKGLCSYMGLNQYTKKWERLHTYGGKLFENICQAVARDVMANAMPLVDEAGYRILLTVHDELLTETIDTAEFGPEGLSALLASPPSWGADLPLAAAGFEAYRYRKD